MSVIDYLNALACKQFKASSKAKNWLDDPHWQKYLRPSTLFNAMNFENYLEESRVSDLPESSVPKPLELDFDKGEA